MIVLFTDFGLQGPTSAIWLRSRSHRASARQRRTAGVNYSLHPLAATSTPMPLVRRAALQLLLDRACRPFGEPAIVPLMLS